MARRGRARPKGYKLMWHETRIKGTASSCFRDTVGLQPLQGPTAPTGGKGGQSVLTNHNLILFSGRAPSWECKPVLNISPPNSITITERCKMASLGCSTLTGTALRPAAATPKLVRAGPVKCHAATAEHKKVLGIGAALLAAASISFAPAANADIISELKEKSAANKELNDRKRLSKSYANLAQSRTVQDGTCTFPYNWLGCDQFLVAGRVKFLADDRELECQGKPLALCDEKMQAAKIPPAFTRSPAQQ